ncbi:MAG: phosphopantothenate/pantothenate synthetase [Thermoplasmata archaeon]|nr:phosphopantothenate/pantothenate synthetase [Thermoplasmata archaeon]
MTRLSPRHPRYRSLRTRAHLADLARTGLVVPEGLIAHGRGEAFDYFLGERTTPSARRAIRAAARWLANARHPVVSVNGNVAALAADRVARLQAARPGLLVEVNLYHRTAGRARKVAERLRDAGVVGVLGVRPTARIPGLPSDRARVDRRGIWVADVCLVPLEDGDRTTALRRLGKRVIAIDLNPMSRTTVAADLPIVDELTRALDRLVVELGRVGPTTPGRFPSFDARGARTAARRAMATRVGSARGRPAAAGRASSRPGRGTPRRSRRTP